MEKIFSLAVVGLLVLGLFSAPLALGVHEKAFAEKSTVPFGDSLDQSQTVNTSGAVIPVGRITILNITLTVLVAQSFVPTKDILTRVKLLVAKNATATYPFVVGIRDNLTHPDLVQTQLNPGQIPAGNFTWIDFDFQDIGVTPGQTYYIVSSTKNATDNFYAWLANNLSDSYPNGVAYASIDNGSTWNQSVATSQQLMNPSTSAAPRSMRDDNGTGDMCFMTYGLQSTTLDITVKSPFLMPSLIVKNTGPTDAQNITWFVTITGGILGKINTSFSGNLTNLAPGDEALVKFGILLGLGPIMVTMRVSAENVQEMTVTINGFIFLFFLILQA